MFSPRASVDVAEKYRSSDWCWYAGFITDLRKWRDTSPDAVTIDAFGPDGQRTRLIELCKLVVLGTTE
jgi:hypothetical protein